MFKLRLDAQGIGSIYNDAGMLGCNNRLDDSGKVVYIRQGLDAEDDIVV